MIDVGEDDLASLGDEETESEGSDKGETAEVAHLEVGDEVTVVTDGSELQLEVTEHDFNDKVATDDDGNEYELRASRGPDNRGPWIRDEDTLEVTKVDEVRQ